MHQQASAAAPSSSSISGEALQARLLAAIAQGRIVPHFQPIVEIESGKLRGFEVLARWDEPGLGDVPPDVFIPIARAAHALGGLTIDLLRTACLAARRWPGEFYLGLNMPPSLLQDQQTVDCFLATIAELGFPLRRVRVEMTEVEVVEQEDAAEASILQLRGLGIKSMLDDFGTGYSSLVRLQRFQFDKIKIDGSFVRSLEHDAASRKIVSAIVGLGKSLGAAVVAESVETRFQLEFLRSIGCDAYQGWLLAKAMDAAQTGEWIAQYRPAGKTPRLPTLSPYHRQYQLETLYEGAPVGLSFIDPELRFMAANDMFCRMLELPRDAIIGRTVEDIVPRAMQAMVTELILRSIYEGISDTREMQVTGRSGTYLISHDRVLDAGGVVLGVSVVAIDVSDRKRYESALRAREENDLAAASHNPTVLWVAEESGEISYIAPHASDVDDAPLHARIEAWYSRIEPADRLRVRAEWEGRDPGATCFEARFRVRWHDDDTRWVVSKAKLHSRGTINRWFGLFTDITREVELERRLGELEAIATRVAVPGVVVPGVIGRMQSG